MLIKVSSRVWSDGGFTIAGRTFAEVRVRAIERCVAGFVIPSDISKVTIGIRDETSYFLVLLRARYRADRIARESLISSKEGL